MMGHYVEIEVKKKKKKTGYTVESWINTNKSETGSQCQHGKVVIRGTWS